MVNFSTFLDAGFPHLNLLHSLYSFFKHIFPKSLCPSSRQATYLFYSTTTIHTTTHTYIQHTYTQPIHTSVRTRFTCLHVWFRVTFLQGAIWHSTLYTGKWTEIRFLNLVAE